MAKKDVVIREEEDRQPEQEKKGEPHEQPTAPEKTEVKNANASGQGSMGRTDESATD